jgi:hypothetical protein
VTIRRSCGTAGTADSAGTDSTGIQVSVMIGPA